MITCPEFGKLRLSSHAQSRMRARSIAPQDICEALDTTIHEWTHREDHHKRIMIGLTSEGQHLKLIIAWDDEPPVLVTAMWVTPSAE